MSKKPRCVHEMGGQREPQLGGLGDGTAANHDDSRFNLGSWESAVTFVTPPQAPSPMCRRRFDSRIRVTRTAGDGRKEGAKHIKT